MITVQINKNMTTDKKTKDKTNVADRGGKILRGIVTSDKMQDTIVVSVTRFVKHPKYRKFIKMVKKYHVHDKGNTASVGDKVMIKECNPISKTKRFTIV